MCYYYCVSCGVLWYLLSDSFVVFDDLQIDICCFCILCLCVWIVGLMGCLDYDCLMIGYSRVFMRVFLCWFITGCCRFVLWWFGVICLVYVAVLVLLLCCSLGLCLLRYFGLLVMYVGCGLFGVLFSLLWVVVWLLCFGLVALGRFWIWCFVITCIEVVHFDVCLNALIVLLCWDACEFCWLGAYIDCLFDWWSFIMVVADFMISVFGCVLFCGWR